MKEILQFMSPDSFVRLLNRLTREFKHEIERSRELFTTGESSPTALHSTWLLVRSPSLKVGLQTSIHQSSALTVSGSSKSGLRVVDWPPVDLTWSQSPVSPRLVAENSSTAYDRFLPCWGSSGRRNLVSSFLHENILRYLEYRAD
ncbi:hypothetical protein T265_00800 [Opisthorchis viverrini]|uniref:Uncharacterized protein n=1 Tax=Opisthorchis viverrini TaxID=6198 RepID=A0A075ABS7_OPIVI|nr:hypothetical protein T265_00800 [Opisthorchis viverrini]KER33300.1 hypothetical protein T265_00800 [Opisthorchis viverrini]